MSPERPIFNAFHRDVCLVRVCCFSVRIASGFAAFAMTPSGAIRKAIITQSTKQSRYKQPRSPLTAQFSNSEDHERPGVSRE